MCGKGNPEYKGHIRMTCNLFAVFLTKILFKTAFLSE